LNLKEGMNVIKSGYIAIIGRPNSGKSTLLNLILGSEISIVTPKAQTTRDRVLGILTEETGQIVFIDTPGIHRAREGGLNSYMVSEAKEAIDGPNLIWYLVDPRSALEHEQTVIDLLKGSKVPVYLLINKMDLKLIETAEYALNRLENSLRPALEAAGVELKKVYRISGLRDLRVQDLLKDSWDLLPEGPIYYPDAEQLSDKPVRYFVSEKIREQLFLQLGEELPYSSAVEIEKFDEKSKPFRIEAAIHVERDSQKGMVIGRGGQKIKEIGQAARAKIEEFVGQKIFLGLRVKVSKEWSDSAEGLRKVGYEPRK
jgi:GTP-binding protein Era